MTHDRHVCRGFILRRAGFVIEPVTKDQAHPARQAYSDFGKGRDPTGLNFGDCFSYALAKASGEALLFKGGDFLFHRYAASRTPRGSICARRRAPQSTTLQPNQPTDPVHTQ